MIQKIDIDNGFSFYNIDEKFKQKCYECAEEINKKSHYLDSFNKVYKLLNNKYFDEVKNVWNIKDIEELFCKDINPYVTNLMIVVNYKNHKDNIENDLVNRHYDGIRISQMLWAIYFIRIKLIETGRLQYEYLNTINGIAQIKIHIPAGNKVDTKLVIESIKKSKQLLSIIFNIKNMEYLCDSWLLSNQLNEIINCDSNIHKFTNCLML